MARTKKRAVKKGLSANTPVTRSSRRRTQTLEEAETKPVELVSRSSEDSEYVVPETLPTEEEQHEESTEQEVDNFIDDLFLNNEAEKPNKFENLTELEWLIADYFAYQVINNILLYGDNLSNEGDLEYRLEAKKYWKDLQAFLNHHDMDDFQEVSRKVTSSQESMKHKDIFLRLLMAGLCQTHFEDDNDWEKIYNVLVDICEIFLPCILSQNTAFDLSLVRFWIDLKTQTIVHGRRRGEDGAELVERHLGDGGDYLFEYIQFDSPESTSKVEKEKELYRKMIKVRTQRCIRFPVEKLSKEMPWTRLLRVVRSFVSRSTAHLLEPKILKFVKKASVPEQESSEPNIHVTITDEQTDVTITSTVPQETSNTEDHSEKDIPLDIQARIIKGLEVMTADELAKEIEPLEPIFNAGSTQPLNDSQSKEAEKTDQPQENSSTSQELRSKDQRNQALANYYQSLERTNREFNVRIQDPLPRIRAEVESMMGNSDDQENGKKRKRYIHEPPNAGVRVRWSTPPSEMEEEEKSAEGQVRKSNEVVNEEEIVEKKRKLNDSSSASTTKLPEVYAGEREIRRDREYSNATQRRKAKGKAPWGQDELDALYDGMRMFGTAWSTILSHFGEQGVIDQRLRRRNQVQLKDKARNERRRRERVGLPLDVFEDACN
ncbi:TTAGGG repeat binding factor [Basidiobolus ranarum]|uniref:TTAGGG repeat binding factor n=1 Tax=Basidiobolus ranarum TaxID=34480 RepID=A0ABR2WLJ5_9FUNG